MKGVMPMVSLIKKYSKERIGNDARSGFGVACTRTSAIMADVHVLQQQAQLEQTKTTKLRGVHETRRSPCTPLLLSIRE